MTRSPVMNSDTVASCERLALRVPAIFFFGVREIELTTEQRAERPGRRRTGRDACSIYSTLGHAEESWDNPVLQGMYFEAIRWALGLVDGDATPRGRRR